MRTPTWQHDLMTYLNNLQLETEKGNVSFNWDPQKEGALNCLTFANGAVKAVLGKDIYEQMAKDEKYDSPFSAYRTLVKMGFNNLDELLSSIFPPKAWPFATYGDLVLIPVQGTNHDGEPVEETELDDMRGMSHAVAVAEPPFYYAMGPNGLTRGLMSDVYKAYKVD